MRVRGQIAAHRSQSRRRSSYRLADGYRLEERTLLATSALNLATPLQFGAFHNAEVSHFLASANEFDLYSVSLKKGEMLEAGVSAQQSGSGLTSLLRVFTANGTPLALDNQQGGDPHLRFQAATAGLYLIGVSSAPNSHYNPRVAASGIPGETIGQYTLKVNLITGTPLEPDLTGSSFRTGTDLATAGAMIPVTFTVQNRGGADPGQFQVQVLVSQSNLFDGSSRLLATLPRSALIASATGRDFTSPAGFPVAVPAGEPSGPAFLGLRIIADPDVPETGLYDKSGVHKGSDWEPLTVVTPVPAGVSDLSTADARLFTEIDGTFGPGQANTWSFTVSSALGNGEWKSEITTTSGNLRPRLTLSGPAGQILIQSDSGQIVQSLEPGRYFLAVSAQTGTGHYRLATAFTQTSLPFTPLVAGSGSAWVTTADVNNDGFPDVITGNRIDDTASVFLGAGDGLFHPAMAFGIGARVWRVSVADVNTDGKLDILTANKGDNTISVLLGNGDGTFQPQRLFPVQIRPGGVTAADLNGDGKPDLAVSNYASDTISVLLGDGNGNFGPQRVYPTGDGSGFAGAGTAALADVNGDGIPDLVYPNYISANVAVRLGRGDGSFGTQSTFPTGVGSYSVKVLDVSGDGKPDIVDANAVDDSVSVLLGNGQGGFAPQKVYSVGFDPYSMTVADLNGDGVPDIVTANRGNNTVSVLLGQGAGSFGSQRVFPTGKSPRSVAVADYNGDGKVDVATANQGDNTVSVLIGNGDGTLSFGARGSVPAPNLRPFQVAIADVSGDGIPDIVTTNRSDNSVSVLLGNRDGSFQTKETFAAGRLPISVAVADLNGDGIPDLVTANYGGNTVSVLFGNDDGTFQPFWDLPAGSDPYDVKVADLNGDGELDIVVTNKNDNTVGVLLGKGDGAFEAMTAYPVASGPYEVVVSDLDGNGIPDIVVSHFSATVVDVLLADGDGGFLAARTFPAGSRPYGLAVADLDGDGRPDIVTANYRDNNVSVLLGHGDGNFGTPVLYAVGKAPNAVKVADLSGDGIPDIVTANYGSDSVGVLLGNGNGTFQPQYTFPAGSGPASVAIGDLNGDGEPDLIVGNRNASTVSVLRGAGGGQFETPITFGAGKERYRAAVADLNGDGKPDVVTTNVQQNSVIVQLGNGDGTFTTGQTVAVGAAPTAVVVSDLNGDGRPDLVTVNSDANAVSVLLGNGDGTFNVQESFAAGRSPRALKVADVSGDGIPDLVIANYNDDTVSVLLGKGDGGFQPQAIFPVEEKPYSLAVADLNGDGLPELIVANSASDSVSVLLNLGAGAGNIHFEAQNTLTTGRQPFSVAVADLNGDGIPDIVTANAFDSTASVLIGNGNATFQSQQVLTVGSRPYSVALADLNGDGKPEIVTTNYGENSVSVLVNRGSGSFPPAQTVSTDKSPVQTIVTDVNGDGRPDLIVVVNHDSATGVLLGKGDGTFQPVTSASGVGLIDTPFLVDLDGDGIADSVVLDRSGDILVRKGLAGATSAFAPPLILNIGRPARDIAIMRIGAQLAVAAADAHFDTTLSASQFVFTVSIYTLSESGSVSRRTAFSTTVLPTRLAAADLTGNGLVDLVTANALDNSVTVVLQTAPGQFAAPITVRAGIAPSNIAVVDVSRDGRKDVVVSDQVSGDLTVVLNDAAHTFGKSLRFRASTGLYGLDATSGSLVVSSFAQSVSLVAGDFTGDGQSDLVVVNQETHSFTVLAGNGNGGFANPQEILTTSTSDGLSINDRPGAIVAGDFNRDGFLDLAVLMQDSGELWIFSGSGNGHFRHTFSSPVGDEATGLAVVPGDGSGLLNLLVGNGFGDVLTLDGKGDGTFQIQGNRVSLSVVPNLLGPGLAGVLVGDQRNNRVTVQAPSANGDQYTAVQTLMSATSSDQLAPGDVEWAVLDHGATLPDAVVVSTGNNAVLVYRTTAITNGVPSFASAPRTYFVGTAPASITIFDLSGDGIPDMLIANQGSNDVSVIFGSDDANGDWVGIPGPRLKSGGDGPIAVTVRNLNGNSTPDLAIVNGGSGTVTVLPGVGQGFFDDRRPKTLFDLNSAVADPPTFIGDSGVGFAVTAGGNLVRFDLDNAAAGANVVFADQHVLAAQALPNGQVVVALASGVVNILVPHGDGLSVASQLLAQGGTPAFPSAIEVLAGSNGNFDVLVTSEGSDILSVFSVGDAAGAVAPPVGGSSSPAVNSLQPFNSIQNPTVTGSQFVILTSTTNATSSSTAASASASASSSSGALSATATSAVGLSLGGFSSVGNGSTKRTGDAMLVSVEGNTYLSVPILDFGFERGDEPGIGEGRMPWLSALHPFGDTSPLARFVMGLDEALQNYRSSEEAPSGNLGRSSDPWNEDLFYRHPPVKPPLLRQEQDSAAQRTGPEAMAPDPHQNPLADDRRTHGAFGAHRRGDPDARTSSPAARIAAGVKVLAGLLIGMLLTPGRSEKASRKTDHPQSPVRREGAAR